jgi:hypothetical protein
LKIGQFNLTSGFVAEKNSKTVLKMSQIIRRVQQPDTAKDSNKVPKMAELTQPDPVPSPRNKDCDYSWDEETPGKRTLRGKYEANRFEESKEVKKPLKKDECGNSSRISTSRSVWE